MADDGICGHCGSSNARPSNEAALPTAATLVGCPDCGQNSPIGEGPDEFDCGDCPHCTGGDA